VKGALVIAVYRLCVRKVKCYVLPRCWHGPYPTLL